MKAKITGTLKYLKHDYKDKSVVLETESGEQIKMRLIRFLNILTKFRDSRISDENLGEWCWETKTFPYGRKEYYIYLKNLKSRKKPLSIWLSKDTNKQNRYLSGKKLDVPQFITSDITLTDFSRYTSSCFALVKLTNCSFAGLEGKEVFMELKTLVDATKGHKNFRFVVKGGTHTVLVTK
jgi:hypothetical protein